MVNYENKRQHDHRIKLFNQLDNKLLQVVLEYTSILRDEMKMNQQNLTMDNITYELYSKQLQIKLKLLIYSIYLNVETHSNIQLELLSKHESEEDGSGGGSGGGGGGGGEQYRRCKKAIGKGRFLFSLS